MEALKQQTADCDFVRFAWSDVHGFPRGKYIHRDCVPRFLKDGLCLFAGETSRRYRIVSIKISNTYVRCNAELESTNKWLIWNWVWVLEHLHIITTPTGSLKVAMRETKEKKMKLEGQN